MAETLRDGVRDLASAQATWITSMASARGFFRNAAPPLPLAPVPESKGSDDEEDDGAEAPGWLGTVQPLVATIAESAVTALVKRAPQTGSDGAVAGASRGFELRELLDWSYSAKKARPDSAAHDGAPPTNAERGTPAMDPEAAQSVLRTKAMAVFSSLEEPERKRLMQLVPSLAKHASDPAMLRIANELLPLSTEQAAGWVRAHLDELEARFAS